MSLPDLEVEASFHRGTITFAVSSNLLGGGSDITHGGKLVWRYNEFFNAGLAITG
jgi:hypothetical protein